MFNIYNQNIYIYELNDTDPDDISWTLKMTKSLRKGQNNVKELSDFFTSFNEAGIKFSFEPDKTKVSGKLLQISPVVSRCAGLVEVAREHFHCCIEGDWTVSFVYWSQNQ